MEKNILCAPFVDIGVEFCFVFAVFQYLNIYLGFPSHNLPPPMTAIYFTIVYNFVSKTNY